MTKRTRSLLPVLAAVLLCAPIALSFLSAAEDIQHKPIAYPPAPRVDHVDDYNGVKVPDPYRWLEDPDSEQTRAWVKAENELTFGYLSTIPAREKIKARLTALWNYERFSAPTKSGGQYFYTRNDGLQDQSVLYTVSSLDGTPRVLIDPNKLSKDGTVSLVGYNASDDGRYLAWATSDGGSDWREFKVRDTQTGEDTVDHIKYVKFSDASWTKDNKGFYYSRYKDYDEKTKLTQANFNQKVYYHLLGTPQSDDKLIYERPDKEKYGFGPAVSEDGQYLLISVSEGTDEKNRFYYQDLKKEGSEIVRLLDDFDATYNFVGNDGPVFWFFTNLNATRGRLIAIDTRNPERSAWKELIPEKKETLRGVNVIADRFIAEYLADARSEVRVHALDGTFIRNVDLPGIGSAFGFGGKRADKETFYSFTSFTTPSTIYRYDVESGKSTVFRQPKVDFNPADYVTEQIFYPSKDGTKIPMFLTYRKGLVKDGSNPTYLYGYGGFNIPTRPSFSVSMLTWMEMGGVYASACLRGGGEYGEEWHQAGMLHNKQNVFDDFIAAGEWLVANKYTSSPKLAIGGRSNGGLLVGAVLNQRPDLFGAALPGVGVMDMLRFNKFTIGWAWTSDYGTPEKPEDFAVLKAYSPLHNIKPQTKYPATLIVTGDHDDRVVPAHSFKYAATIQSAQAGTEPVMIRIETRAGHGAGRSTTQVIEEVTDQWSFLVRELGMDAAKEVAADVAAPATAR